MWCERIEDDTAAPFNRQERIEGSDFVAEVLRTVDRAKEDPELQKRLGDDFSDLYHHHNYRKHLSDCVPSGDDFAALIDEAEAIVVNLLAGDDV